MTTPPKASRKLFVAAIVAALGACGAPASTPDQDAGPDAGPDPSLPVAYLRLALAKTAAGVEVREEQTIEAALPRSPAAAGGYAVIGWHGATPVVVAPFGFATKLVKEGFSDDGEPATGSIVDVDGVASILLPIGGDQPVDRFTVVDAAGATVVDHPVGGARVAAAPGPGDGSLRLLEPSERDLVPAGFGRPDEYAMQSFAALPESKRQQIRDAIAILPPRVRASVTTIILAKFPGDLIEPPRCPGGGNTITAAMTVGSYILINARYIDNVRLPQALAHEAGHAYSFALSPSDENSLPANVPDAVRVLAEQTMRENLLGDGFIKRWEGLHAAAVAKQMAGPYFESEAPMCPLPTRDQAAARGFVSPYGGTASYEDIAEWTQQLATPGEAPAFCAKLRAVGSGPVPKDLVIPYVKLLLLDESGFVNAGAAAACYGNLGVHGPKGINLDDESGHPVLTATGGLKGGWVTQDGADFLVVLADGPSGYHASLRVLAPGRKPPLGLHDLATIGWANLNQANNAMYLANDNPDHARTSAQGLVLVSEVSTNRIEMSVFMLQLKNAYGMVTDTFPLATFVYEP